ncbi:MAG: 16S rRNA methyltransferase [Candidatus Helarchaeota archaeon]
MIILILVDTSLELIPVEICKVKAIKKEAERKNKKTRHVLLDSARHRPFMVNYKLKNKDKRGRPDILHRFLLFALGTEASKENKIKIFVHTLFNRTFEVKNDLRLPRNYTRFVGLMEQLLVKKKIPLQGEPLIQLKKQTLSELIDEINPTKVILLSEKGSLVKINDYLNGLPNLEENKYVFLIGGFAFGEFSEEISEISDETISLSKIPLSSTVTCAKLIINYENLIE